MSRKRPRDTQDIRRWVRPNVAPSRRPRIESFPLSRAYRRLRQIFRYVRQGVYPGDEFSAGFLIRNPRDDRGDSSRRAGIRFFRELRDLFGYQIGSRYWGFGHDNLDAAMDTIDHLYNGGDIDVDNYIRRNVYSYEHRGTDRQWIFDRTGTGRFGLTEEQARNRDVPSLHALSLRSLHRSFYSPPSEGIAGRDDIYPAARDIQALSRGFLTRRRLARQREHSGLYAEDHRQRNRDIVMNSPNRFYVPIRRMEGLERYRTRNINLPEMLTQEAWRRAWHMEPLPPDKYY